jgi:hypothetical protein
MLIDVEEETSLRYSYVIACFLFTLEVIHVWEGGEWLCVHSTD